MKIIQKLAYIFSASFNKKLAYIFSASIIVFLAASFASWHALFHVSYVLLGLCLGMMIGRQLTEPKLISKKFVLENCYIDLRAQNPDELHSADGSACTVVVMRQYCYIVNTPTPQQICYWVREEHPGRWNARLDCCEAIVDGRNVCVRPRLRA